LNCLSYARKVSGHVPICVLEVSILLVSTLLGYVTVLTVYIKWYSQVWYAIILSFNTDWGHRGNGMVLCHFQQYFSYIMTVSFIGAGNRSTRRKPRPELNCLSYARKVSGHVPICVLEVSILLVSTLLGYVTVLTVWYFRCCFFHFMVQEFTILHFRNLCILSNISTFTPSTHDLGLHLSVPYESAGLPPPSPPTNLVVTI
jgi:hypothetical protein